MKLLQESFPYYLNNDRKNVWLILGHSLFIIAFLCAFHPTQLEHFRKFVVIGAVIFVVLYVTIIGFPKIMPDIFDTVGWTTGKYFLFTLFQCFLIGVFAPLAIYYSGVGAYSGKTFWEIAWIFQIRMLLYGSISITLITFVIRNVMLRTSLRHAIEANEELKKIRQIKEQEQIPTTPGKVTIQSDTSEILDLHLPDLLYIESDDNYSTVYWKNGHELEKKMLRMNLKNVETQLDNGFVIRCHRSFIVNINAITEVSGNTSGYKLSICNTGVTVPVSRAKGKEVIEKIRQIRNFAEIH